MLADTTVSVVVSVCDHGNVVRLTRCGCPLTSAQTSIPPSPMEPDNSYVTRLGLNSGGACGGRTVMTGGGGGEVAPLPHQHRPQRECNDGNQWHPDSRQDSPAD